MGERTLLIKKKDDTELQIDIPEEWKVTFGPAAAGIARSEGRVPLALRIYETEKLQRAIFTDVESFRDMSIPIREKRINTQTKDGFVEVDGARKRTSFQAQTMEWVNPDGDEPKTNNLIDMPSDQEIFNNVAKEEICQ